MRAASFWATASFVSSRAMRVGNLAPAPGRAQLAQEARREPPSQGLKRNAPLVPTDSAGSRALVGVIAILTFLAALCAGAAELVAASSAQWRSALVREVTLQVRPVPGRDVEADVTAAVDLIRRAPRVSEVRALTKAESERLLEPWLGAGLDVADLPIPRLVTITLLPGRRPDLADLRQQLAQVVPGASLDDHGLWMSRLSAMA